MIVCVRIQEDMSALMWPWSHMALLLHFYIQQKVILTQKNLMLYRLWTLIQSYAYASSPNIHIYIRQFVAPNEPTNALAYFL